MTEISLLDRPHEDVDASDRKARGSTVAERREFDACAKLIRNWSTVYNLLVDWHGWPSPEISRLDGGDPANIPNESGRRPQGAPRLLEIRGPGCAGEWCCLGNGARGDDLVAMIVYLSGGCDRRAAVDYLVSLADRLVELPR